MLFRLLLQRIERLLADHQHLALKRVLVGAILPASDNRLLDHGHGCDHCFAQSVQRYRHIAPSDQALAFLLRELFKLLSDESARSLVLRHKAHRDCIIALCGKLVTLILRPIAQKLVRNLHQDACAITQQRISAHRPTMVDIFENLERLADYSVRGFALDMRDKADAAGIVFVSSVIKALGRWVSHRKNPSCQMPIWWGASRAYRQVGHRIASISGTASVSLGALMATRSGFGKFEWESNVCRQQTEAI